MRSNKNKTISIRKKLLIVMLVVVLLQGVLFLFVLVSNGGMGYLKEHSFNTFYDTSALRRSRLETVMVNNMTSLGNSEDRIQRIIQEELLKRNKSVTDMVGDKELNNQLLIAVSQHMLDLLHNSKATEAFLILDGYGSGEETNDHCGLMIRDLDPDTNTDTSDLLLEVGANDMVNQLGIALDTYWNARFILDEEKMNTDFYWEPARAARQHTQYAAKELAYWSEMFRWNKGDTRVMSCSIPLKLDGHVYGIMGITMSEDYIKSLLPYIELDNSGKATYVLATTDKELKKYDTICANGVFDNYLEENLGSFQLGGSVEGSSVSRIEGTKNWGAVHSLNLYSRNSPFYSTRWAVAAVEPENILFYMTNRLNLSLIIASAMSILLGAAGAFVGSYSFTKPIQDMVRHIQTNKSEREIAFKKTNVKEINALGNAITDLNENVRESGSKLARIIEQVDMPLGAVEYSENADKIFCTSKVIPMLFMDSFYYENGYVDKEYFDEFLEEKGLLELLLRDTEIDCHVQGTGEEHWIHIRSLSTGDKVLITLQDITQDVYEKQRMEYERDYDMLTHLLNRGAFKRALKRYLPDNQEEERKLGAMIMWDLDNLKYINDSYGHDYGDQYIQRAANVFGRFARDKNAVVGRISGDEFLFFVPVCSTRQELLDTVMQIKEALNSTKICLPDGEEIPVRASGGIAWYPDDGTTYEELKRYADFAMYDTKNSYKGEFKEFDRRNYERDYLLLQGKEELNKLIENKMVEYAFQPIVSAMNGCVIGYEALMRPTIESFRSPGDVMRLASAQSRLWDIERLTFTESLKAYSSQRENFGNSLLFINSIPSQLISESVIQELERDYGEDLHRLVIEIIENEQSDGEIMEAKHKLAKRLNAEIAVDDFGAGYSSESVLLYMQPRYVKIDISIVKEIHKDADRQMLVSNLLAYTRDRGIKVIAEGIECMEEMEVLIDLGVDYLQGYYLGYPNKKAYAPDAHVVREIRACSKKCGRQY